MITRSNGGVYRQSTARGCTPRTPIRTYKPDNANVIAAMTYQDVDLGIVAVTHRSSLGIMRASTAIHFDAVVFDRLVADGCQWLECFIKETKITYRAHCDTMRQHGQLQQRFGLQRVLHLKYWSIVGDDTKPTLPELAQPRATQISLF